MFKRSCTITICLSLFVVFCISQTSLSLFPLQFDFKISPGKTKKETIYIANDSFDPIHIKADIKDWTLEKDGTFILADSLQSSFSCKAWIRLDIEEFNLAPGERKPIRYKITVPKNSTPGHYWAAISFVSRAKELPIGQMDKMVIRENVMSGIFVQIGNDKPEGRIVDLILYENNGEKEIKIDIENEGRFYFWTDGRIEIKDGKDKRIISKELPEERILPGARRELRLTLDEKIEPGNYSVICILKLPSHKTLEFQKNIAFK
jgi:hypothetical protein